MAEFTFLCPKCKGAIKADTVDVGLRGECPECKGAVIVPEPPQEVSPAKAAVTPPVKQPAAMPKQEGLGFVVAGWICFGLGSRS